MSDQAATMRPGVKPVAAAKAPPQTVRFFLQNGAVVEWPVPADQPFGFHVLVNSIRSAGFFLTPDVYIPLEAIVCIGMSGGAVRLMQPEHATRQ